MCCLFFFFVINERMLFDFFFFFSSRRRHTRLTCDWSSDVCSSDLVLDQNFRCPIHLEKCPPRKPPELLITGVESAELIKHASNAFLAVKISYANVLADLCERLGADVQEVTRAVGLDQRIGPRFLEPGIGFGGPRLPKDLAAFCRLADRTGVEAGIHHAAQGVNRGRIDHFFEKVQRSLWVLKDKRICFLGLAHK